MYGIGKIGSVDVKETKITQRKIAEHKRILFIIYYHINHPQTIKMKQKSRKS